MSTVPVVVTARNAAGLTTTRNSVINVTDSTSWPSLANRPQWTNTGGGGTLTWTGPLAGSPSTANDVQQSRVLTPSGSVSSSADGQIIEGLNINGSVNITHKNVTVRRCYIHSSGEFNFMINGVARDNIVIEDNFLAGDVNGVASYYGISNAPNLFGANLTIRRNAIRGCDNCVGSDFRDGLIIDNLFYASKAFTTAGHVDLIEVYTQQAALPLALTIRHNTFDCTGPARGSWAAGLNVGALGRIDNIVVDNNRWINASGKQFGLTYSFSSAQGGSNGQVRITTTNNGIRNTNAFWGLSGGLTRITVAGDSGNFIMASDTATSGAPWDGNGKIH